MLNVPSLAVVPPDPSSTRIDSAACGSDVRESTARPSKPMLEDPAGDPEGEDAGAGEGALGLPDWPPQANRGRTATSSPPTISGQFCRRRFIFVRPSSLRVRGRSRV